MIVFVTKRRLGTRILVRKIWKIGQIRCIHCLFHTSITQLQHLVLHRCQLWYTCDWNTSCLSLHGHKVSREAELPFVLKLPNRFPQRTGAFSPTWRFLILPYFFCIAWSSSQSRLRVSIEKACDDVACLNAKEGLFVSPSPKTNSKSQLPIDNLRKHRLSVFIIKRWLHTHNPTQSST